MGLEFIDRSLKTSGIVLLIFLPFGLYYLGVYPTLAVFSGGIWSILNLLFIVRLVKTTIRPDGIDRFRAVGLAIIKFPLLYLAGYFLLRVKQFDPLYLLIGFSSVLAVMILKVVGRALVDSSDKEEHSGEPQRVL